jgi:hypothetical protein
LSLPIMRRATSHTASIAPIISWLATDPDEADVTE